MSLDSITGTHDPVAAGTAVAARGAQIAEHNLTLRRRFVELGLLKAYRAEQDDDDIKPIDIEIGVIATLVAAEEDRLAGLEAARRAEEARVLAEQAAEAARAEEARLAAEVEKPTAPIVERPVLPSLPGTTRLAAPPVRTAAASRPREPMTTCTACPRPHQMRVADARVPAIDRLQELFDHSPSRDELLAVAGCSQAHRGTPFRWYPLEAQLEEIERRAANRANRGRPAEPLGYDGR